jgi:hypothetical protein
MPRLGEEALAHIATASAGVKHSSSSPVQTGADERHRSRDAIGAQVLSNSEVARPVARMQRSAIRGRSISFYVAPGFRCAPPGLRRERKKEAERRQTLFNNLRTSGCGRATDRDRLAPTRPLSGALACRRSTTALAKESISSPRRDPGQASWEAASTGRASRRRRRTHFQRCTPRSGRSAGRHDARTARERIATPPAGTDLAPTPGYACRTRPFGQGLIPWFVTEIVTDVNREVTSFRRAQHKHSPQSPRNKDYNFAF